MAENEMKLVEAAAVVHEVNPKYAAAFLDGVKAAVAAMKEGEPDENQSDGDKSE